MGFGSSATAENSARILYTYHGSEAGSEPQLIKAINIGLACTTYYTLADITYYTLADITYYTGGHNILYYGDR